MTHHPSHEPPEQAVLRTRHYFTPQSLRAENDPPARAVLTPRPTEISARGCTLEFVTGVGVFSKSGLDAGSRLLIETITFSPHARLCDLGCGWGAVGCFAAKLAPEAQVWTCDINLNAVMLASGNIRQNNLSQATAWCGNGLKAIGGPSFDAVFCNPPIRAGNAVIAELFDDAHRSLRPGGALWIVIRTAQGAKSWQRRLAELFGNCETIAIDGGYRILKCVKV